MAWVTCWLFLGRDEPLGRDSLCNDHRQHFGVKPTPTLRAKTPTLLTSHHLWGHWSTRQRMTAITNMAESRARDGIHFSLKWGWFVISVDGLLSQTIMVFCSFISTTKLRLSSSLIRLVPMRPSFSLSKDYLDFDIGFSETNLFNNITFPCEARLMIDKEVTRINQDHICLGDHIMALVCVHLLRRWFHRSDFLFWSITKNLVAVLTIIRDKLLC